MAPPRAPARLLLVLLLVAAPLAAAHGWAPQRTDTRDAHLVAQDCNDDWGVGHALVDGHDLGAIYLREEIVGGEPKLRLTIGFAGGYATPGATGPRRIEVTLESPRVATTLTLATQDNVAFTATGTSGVAPQLLAGPYRWRLPAGQGEDTEGRLGLDLGLRYDQLKVVNGEALRGVSALSYIGPSQKADFLPGGTYTSAGSYVANCATNATAAPEDAWYARASFPIVASPWNASGPAAPPVAAFTLTPSEPRAGQAVQFLDASAAGASPIAGWEWSFGDGANATTRNATHTFAQPGTYVVNLTVRAADGLRASAQRTVAVLTPGTLSADFGVSPTVLRAGQTATFTDASTPGPHAIVGYAWSFGDGAFSSERSPRHAYGVAGSFTANLTVTDAGGGTARASHVVRVHEADAPPPPENAPPTAAFSIVGPTYVGEPVRILDESRDPDGQVRIWEWDFGDGATGTGASPVHAYKSPATYVVTLTVRDDRGDVATAVRALRVLSPPPPPATPEPTPTPTPTPSPSPSPTPPPSPSPPSPTGLPAADQETPFPVVGAFLALLLVALLRRR